jgi:hypothetical protein
VKTPTATACCRTAPRTISESLRSDPDTPARDEVQAIRRGRSRAAAVACQRERPMAIGSASKQQRGSTAILATAPQPAHRLARGVEALAPRSDRRQPEANPQDQCDPPVRSPVGARSARSGDGEISPRVRGVPEVLAHAHPKRYSFASKPKASGRRRAAPCLPSAAAGRTAFPAAEPLGHDARMTSCPRCQGPIPNDAERPTGTPFTAPNATPCWSGAATNGWRSNQRPELVRPELRAGPPLA